MRVAILFVLQIITIVVTGLVLLMYKYALYDMVDAGYWYLLPVLFIGTIVLGWFIDTPEGRAETVVSFNALRQKWRRRLRLEPTPASTPPPLPRSVPPALPSPHDVQDFWRGPGRTDRAEPPSP